MIRPEVWALIPEIEMMVREHSYWGFGLVHQMDWYSDPPFPWRVITFTVGDEGGFEEHSISGDNQNPNDAIIEAHTNLKEGRPYA